MINKTLATAIIAITFCSNASADTILGIYLGANSWQQDYDGFVRDLDTTNPLLSDIDFVDDLGLEDDSGSVIYAALEHPIPFLPNIKIQQTKVEIDGDNTLARQIEFGGETFNVSENVVSEADLSHEDITLYYEVLDNWVSLDLGLTVRFFDGFVSVESATESAREDFDSPVPLLYAAAKFELPLSGLYVGGNINAIGVSDSSFLDYQVIVGYESKWGLGVEAGFRSMELELDDIDDIDTDLTIDGAFFGVMYHF